MKYVYIGVASHEDELNKIYSKYARKKIVYIQQRWDYIFCKAFEKLCEGQLDVISYPPVQTYPAGNKIFIKHNTITGLKHGVYIGVCNLPVIKQIMSCRKVLKELKKIPKDEEVRIITHTVYLQSLIAANKYKKINKNAKVYSLVPDLPEFSTGEKLGKSIIMQLLYEVYKKISEKYAYNVDGYICFSKYQMEKLNKEKPFMVMEGFSIENEDIEVEIPGMSQKAFFYAGNLKNDSGVYDFAKAFVQAYKDKEEYEFWICGEGEQYEQIASLNSMQIKLLGVQPRDKILAMEKKAYVLVNPRPADELFSRYSFPSKLLEYMSTGTPVLTTHLPCIESRYNKYLYYLEDEKEVIKTLTFLDIKKTKGDEAKRFVRENLNPEIQAQRVLNFVNSK